MRSYVVGLVGEDEREVRFGSSHREETLFDVAKSVQEAERERKENELKNKTYPEISDSERTSQRHDEQTDEADCTIETYEQPSLPRLVGVDGDLDEHN